MILSFDDDETQKLWDLKSSKRFSNIARPALRKLIALDAAEKLFELNIPPGNRLEALKGKEKGFFSIRINDQWRIVFYWTANGPCNVEIIDYH